MERALSEAVRDALNAAPLTTRTLAQESGLSYDLLRSWRSGRRRATPASARRLAAGLEVRARQLLALSREIKRRSDRG